MTTDFKKRTRNLAYTYLAIIMTLSILFSVILYIVMAAQLDRPLPPQRDKFDNQIHQEISENFDARIEERDQETRNSMVILLITLNVLMLAGGAWLSIFLARRTLEPVQQAMEAQSRFISDASHELRTPLTALQTINEVTLRKKKIEDSKAREVLNKNINEATKLHKLTDALLNLSQTERRELELEKLNLDELVLDVVSTVSPAAEDKSIKINTTVEQTEITTDRIVLAQIITILIDNAIKYSSENTAIEVGLDTNKDSIRLYVSDQGIGISPEDKAHIFDRFYRADAARTRTDTSGHGLGLSIAKTLAEQLGSKLTVKSTPGKGSTFSITLSR